MILGAIAGDMVGSVFEFDNIKSVEFPLFSEGSRFTDDSAMTLAVADAIMAASEGALPVSQALVASMQEVGRRYPGAGYGGSFSRWLGARNPQPYGSWGNGSAMRVSPAGWVCETLEATELVAAETAKVTHNHFEGIRGAQAVAGCIYLVRKGADKAAVAEYAQGRHGYNLDFTLDAIRPIYTFDVSCQGSVPQAIVAFLEGESFEDVIRRAVSIGGASDPIAAIAASIAQPFFGVPEQIEVEVRRRLPADLLDINDRFCAAYGL